jgi:hypothetical protein
MTSCRSPDRCEQDPGFAARRHCLLFLPEQAHKKASQAAPSLGACSCEQISPTILQAMYSPSPATVQKVQIAREIADTMLALSMGFSGNIRRSEYRGSRSMITEEWHRSSADHFCSHFRIASHR